MSNELLSYVSKMSDDYNEIISNIKSQKEENPSRNFLDLLLSNNKKVQEYLIHFSIGTGLENIDDNKRALKELNKKHIEFMDYIYSL